MACLPVTAVPPPTVRPVASAVSTLVPVNGALKTYTTETDCLDARVVGSGASGPRT